MIRETESRIVSRLFAFEFFHGAAVALYFTAAISIFLRHIGTQGLPEVYVLSAFLLWGAGLIYNFLEHRLTTVKLVFGILAFNGICILVFRILSGFRHGPWFLYVFLAAFNVFYLLENLEFWGLAALLFDVRQSKRLFAIVSAGDLPAKLIGYMMALIFTTAAGTIDLLWVATGCLAVSMLIFWSMSRTETFKSLTPSTHHHFATQSLQNIQASLTGNRLILQVALVSFFSFSFYVLASFMLYGYVERKFHTDASLATFFAFFYGASRMLTLIIKPVFTGRMLDKLGLRKSLLIAPVILLALGVAALIISSGSSDLMVFYMIMIVAVAVDLLRSVIELPVLLATLQPLPVRQRLRGHTIIKGLMDPFAYLSIGLLLFAVMAQRGVLDFELLFAILIFIAVAWILFTFFVDRSYIRMLTAAIRKRTLDERDISLTDADSINFLASRLENGTPEEASAVLHLVSSQPAGHDGLYLKALKHHAPEVRLLALKMIQENPGPAFLPELIKMLEEKPDPESTAQLVRTVAVLDFQLDLSPYLAHENPGVAAAAAMGMLTRENTQKAEAEDYLFGLLSSGEENQQISFLTLVADMSVFKFSGAVLDLCGHQNSRIRRQALQAAGKLATPESISRLLDLYRETGNDLPILDGLYAAGMAALPGIREAIRSGKCTTSQRRRLYKLVGKIGNEDSLFLLQQFLEEFPEDADQLLFLLHQLHFRAETNSQTFRIHIEENLEMAAYNLFRLQFMKGQHKEFGIFIQALELELIATRNRLFWLFSFLYNEEKIRRIRSGIDLGSREALANALELIGMEVPREYADPFIIIYEKADLREKCDLLKKHYREHTITMDHLVRDVLITEAHGFSDWTKSALIYCFRGHLEDKYRKMVTSCLESEDPILRETAGFILEQKITDL